jgi:hypothetical protein
VVLPGVDGLFGGVGLMDVWRCVLEGSALGFSEFFDIF